MIERLKMLLSDATGKILRKHTKKAKSAFFRKNISFYFSTLGPGCNPLKYDFLEKNLKIHDFFGRNLQSIFTKKNIFFLKIRPKNR